MIAQGARGHFKGGHPIRVPEKEDGASTEAMCLLGFEPLLPRRQHMGAGRVTMATLRHHEVILSQGTIAVFIGRMLTVYPGFPCTILH